MNKILIAIIAAGFGTQLIKMIIYYFQHKRLSLNDIFVTGGMPSSHSAFVVSLTTAIYLQEGASTAFAISLVLALIIIRDAFGVRRTVGKEGQALQKLFKIHKLKSKYHYAMGHTPLQVTVGALLGFLITLAIFLI
ncbi:divergent PAP2 family protein [Candidatus Woesearchaeota archaeon]|nr:divergent PAP2 family protein [Candidatus Woesearchaeota archaeon]